jgi:hypothetical protein
MVSYKHNLLVLQGCDTRIPSPFLIALVLPAFPPLQVRDDGVVLQELVGKLRLKRYKIMIIRCYDMYSL